MNLLEAVPREGHTGAVTGPDYSAPPADHSVPPADVASPHDPRLPRFESLVDAALREARAAGSPRRDLGTPGAPGGLEMPGERGGRRDIPIGAVVAGPDGSVVGAAGNRREVDQDPTAHAEILALREAAARAGRWNLTDHILAVTLEPCTMCAGALVQARIRTVVYGAPDPKAGACGSLLDVVRDPRLNHRVEVVGGVRGAECSADLRDFFRNLRAERKQRPGS